MKKKTIVMAIMLMLIPAMIFADFSYSLDLLSFDPIYKEYTADRNRAGLDFHYLMLNKDGFPDGLYQDNEDLGGAVWYPFTKYDSPFIGFRSQPFMGLIHMGETLSLFRNTFRFDSFMSPIAFDFSFQGQIDFGFEGAMADLIGFDGWFFYGATASIADKVSMRFGLHHVCSHMGDGTIKLIGWDVGEHPDGLRIFKKYIRMNAFAIGLSVEPVDWLRVYAEYNFLAPGITDAVDMMFFSPGWYDDHKNVKGKDDTFRSDMVNFGIELSYPIFKSLGNTTIAYDCRAYEEGRIVYKKEDIAKRPDMIEPGKNSYYDPNLPWEFEHNLLIAQEINDLVSFEIGFHHGRFPINTFFHQRCTYGFVGARLNFKSTVNLVDTAK